MKKQKTSGFTLFEALIATSVVAVLYGVILPIGKRIITRAHIEADRIQIALLATGYGTAVTDNPSAFKDAKDLISCVEALAQTSTANTLGIYQSTRRGGRSDKKILDTNGYAVSGLKKSDFDFILVHPLHTEKYGSAVPAVYTRWLLPNGKWAKNGLYAERGLIGFTDGTVREYVGTADPALLTLIFPNPQLPEQSISKHAGYFKEGGAEPLDEPELKSPKKRLSK